MEKETSSVISSISLNEDVQPKTDKKPYTAPKLQHYGGLSELVQRNPGRGRDGGGFIDCTLT